MALNLASLAGKTATITVEFLGQTAKVVYDPMVLTQENYTLAQSGGDAAFAEFFCRLVKSWDVTHGTKKVPLTTKGINAVPMPFLRAVFGQIMVDGAGDVDEGKASSGT